MPTILTPRDTEPRSSRLEDNGTGRRPPIDKHTGGGGSGDNDNNWDHRRQPRSRLMHYRMGIFSALAGDMLFFGGLVAVFFATRGHAHFDLHTNQYVHPWNAIAIPHILRVNTAALILSSITMEIARRRMFREMDVMEEWLGLGKPTSNNALPWLAATTALGLAFLLGQWKAWEQLATQHISRFNPSGSFFYLITGIHAVHLVLGIVALMAAMVSLYRARQVETRQIFVDCVAWYWHSMGLFWIFLFILLTYFQ